MINFFFQVRKIMTSYSQITQTSYKKDNFKTENDQPLEILKYHCIFGQFETPIYWGNLVLITALHLVTAYQLMHFDYFGHPFFFIYCEFLCFKFNRILEANFLLKLRLLALQELSESLLALIDIGLTDALRQNYPLNLYC